MGFPWDYSRLPLEVESRLEKKPIYFYGNLFWKVHFLYCKSERGKYNLAKVRKMNRFFSQKTSFTTRLSNRRCQGPRPCSLPTFTGDLFFRDVISSHPRNTFWVISVKNAISISKRPMGNRKRKGHNYYSMDLQSLTIFPGNYFDHLRPKTKHK